MSSKAAAGATIEDVAMTTVVEQQDTLLRLVGDGASKMFLVKMPQWVADVISQAEPGTEIGFSHELIDGSAGAVEDPRFVVSADLVSSNPGKPVEYASQRSSSNKSTRVMESSGSTTTCSSVTSTMHMLPKRDEKYASLLKDRLNRSDPARQHRTVHNEDDYSTSRTSLKLFQRPDLSSDLVREPVSSPGSSYESTRVPKRIRALDEMPQIESRGASLSSPSPQSLDDALMQTLVNRDEGWPLQLLSKALKEKGVSAPMAQLKAKLLEICVYQRRGEDSHPKYYLKSEYK